MSQKTTIQYTCDICGKRGNPGGGEWKRVPICLCKAEIRASHWISQGPSERLDLCGDCWASVIRGLEERARLEAEGRV